MSASHNSLSGTRTLNLVPVLQYILDHFNVHPELNPKTTQEALKKLKALAHSIRNRKQNPNDLTVGDVKRYLRRHPDEAKKIFVPASAVQGGRSCKSKRSKKSRKTCKSRK